MRSLVETLGKNLLGRVGQIGTILVQHIPQPEAKFKFGDELEEWKIEITAHSEFQHHIERFRLDLGMFAGSQVVGGLQTADYVGTEIIETRRTHLEVQRQGYISGLHVLRLSFPGGKIAESDMLAPEMQGGYEPDSHIVVEFPLAKHPDTEAQSLLVTFRQPLVSRRGIDISVVVQFEPLVMHTYKKAIMKTPLVDKGLVLYLSLLGLHICPSGHNTEEQQKQEPM